MGNLFRRWHTAGCLLGVSATTESRRRVTLFRVSIWRDRRAMLYVGSHRGGRLAGMWLPDLRPFPFWVQPLTGVGWFSMTTPQRTFTCVVPSHLLNGVTPSGSALTAFPSRFPRLITSLTRGEGAVTSSTRGAGVDGTHRLCYHRTCMDTQLRKSDATFVAHPPPQRAVSGEQVAHTRCSRRGGPRLHTTS